MLRLTNIMQQIAATGPVQFQQDQQRNRVAEMLANKRQEQNLQIGNKQLEQYGKPKFKQVTGADGRLYEVGIDPSSGRIVGQPQLVGAKPTQGVGPMRGGNTGGMGPGATPPINGGFNTPPVKRPAADTTLAGYLPEAEQLEYNSGQASPLRMRQLETKANVLKRQQNQKPEPTADESLETFRKKEEIKAEVKKEASDNPEGKKIAIEDAQDWYRKIKNGQFQTGATQSALEMIPGRFTQQSQMNEQFDAFAERAAREALKAVGEVRPTDADVEGMKKAIFGVGKDEDTNLKLLENFIRERGGDVPSAEVPNAPKAGQVMDGYIFQGGDPSNPKSWKKQ